MAKKFDFSKDWCYFGTGTYTGDLNAGMIRNLSVQFHEALIPASMDTFFADVTAAATRYAHNAGLENVRITKGFGLSIHIFSNGTLVATYPIDVYVEAEDMEDRLPNGEKAEALSYYEWASFDTVA